MECAWDGNDCDSFSNTDHFLPGSLIFIILVPPSRLHAVLPSFLRQISLLLRGLVTVKRDAEGREMVYPWPENEDEYRKQMENGRVWKRASGADVRG